MGIFDVFKKKDSAPAPAPKPTPAPAAPAPAPKPADGLGKPVSLKIKENPIFFDPDYRSVDLVVICEAEVSHPDRCADASTEKIIKSIINLAINEWLSNLGKDRVSYKEVPGHKDALLDIVKESLTSSGYTLSKYIFISAEPSDASKARIKQLEQTLAFSKMSPEEQQKYYEAKMKEAQAAMEKLSPEERQKAADEAVARMQQSLAERDKIIQQAQSMSAANKAAAKCCPSCGQPSTGAKFCTNCGSPME